MVQPGESGSGGRSWGGGNEVKSHQEAQVKSMGTWQRKRSFLVWRNKKPFGRPSLDKCLKTWCSCSGQEWGRDSVDKDSKMDKPRR